MITIRKLKTLKPGTLRRKTAVLLQAFETDLIKGRAVDRLYLKEFLGLTVDAFVNEERVSESARGIRNVLGDLSGQELLRELNALRHRILSVLGSEPADWDLSVDHPPVSRDEHPRLLNSDLRTEAGVYLDDLRSPFNVGSIFRTSEAFGVSKIFLSDDCPPPDHPRSLRSSMGCTELVPWRRSGLLEAAADKIVFALEVGGTPIEKFEFPERGLAIIGSEELGISPEARKAAEKSAGLVSIPVHGLKGSINVSVAFGIMMQRWSETLNLH
ncbi:MAG: TrmH family RNA methyltransferase [Spirochaetales bacterium]|uniref:TrmH family RNA methyltransferase n=1 Tax=Candidatus Thalassospirochaeta sargassi TaxID=3119039 RepID=A0AAJ1IHS3_9SPIO|nr:TrmH family RNA methyltransferase [Spirochaetales bacterium]